MQDAVLNPGYSERPLALAVRLGDVDPPHRLRPVAVSLQLLPQLFEHPIHAVGFHLGDGLSVDARRATVVAHLLPGTLENIAPSNPVVQRMETPLSRLLGREIEPALELADFV